MKLQKRLSLLLVSLLAMGLLHVQLPKAEAATVTPAQAPMYGRSALADMSNAGALLYAYDKIAEGIESSAASIRIWDGKNAISPAELEMVWDVYRRDYAHHFWLGNSYSYGSTNGVSMTFLNPEYIMSGSALEEAKEAFNAEAEGILAGITPSMSDYEKELYIHDTLAKRITYVRDAGNGHNAYGALVEGQSVCEGYAESLQYLLQRVGIQSFLIEGIGYHSDGSYEAHEWNAVKIGGSFHHVDLTWDDQEERIYHGYFNVTDTMIRYDHGINVTKYALPECNDISQFYYKKVGGYLETYTVDQVAQLLKKYHGSAPVYIPGSVSEFENWYLDNWVTIARKAGATGGISTKYSTLGHEMVLIVPQLQTAGHQYEAVVTPPTCTEGGYTTYTCGCGDTYTGNLVSALGHDYDNGFCSACVAYEPAVLNSDGAYEICNAGQLYWFAAQVDNDYENFGTASAILTENITIPATVGQDADSKIPDWDPIGESLTTNDGYVYQPFAGTFDGNGKFISGIYCVSKAEKNNFGLFASNKGTIQNLTVLNSTIKSLYGNIGGIVGTNLNATGTVRNCSFSGTVSSLGPWDEVGCVGGIAGGNTGIIEGCFSNAVVEAGKDYNDELIGTYYGGIIGSNDGIIRNCTFQGTVNGSYRAGGIAGENPNGTITACVNDGSISADIAGGIVGWNGGLIENCRNTGNCQTSSAYAGGIAGVHTNIYILDDDSVGCIRNCCNTANLYLVARSDINHNWDDGTYPLQSIENCYNYSKSGYGIVDAYISGIITDCYYQNTSEADEIDGTTYKTTDQFASGEVTYLLNGDQSDILWYQTCGTGLPGFSGNQVYRNQTGGCTTNATYMYSNTAAEPVVKHSYTYAVSQEPTLTEVGELTAACTVCGGSGTPVELPKLDEYAYQYTVTKEPTNTETGCATYVWNTKTYGAITITVTLDKLAILYGDVNSDGEVSGKDRSILARYLAEWEGYTEDMIDMAAADVNQDGVVNGKDRSILARYLAEWIGYEILPYTG